MIFKLDNGVVDCHVIFPLKKINRDYILKDKDVQEYFSDDSPDDINIEMLDQKEPVAMNCDGMVITHTAEEWEHIYSEHIGIICQSEY